MTVVGIETATDVCGAAIVANGELLSHECVIEKYAHAESIMHLIDTALKRAGVAQTEVDAIAVSIGPGSFTGLRIGLSVAKGLAYSLQKPLIAVPTLQALALRAVEAGVIDTPYLLATIDARRDDVYCQLFRVAKRTTEPAGEERDFSLKALGDELGEREITVTGDAAQKVKQRYARVAVVDGELAQCSAVSVAMIGERMLHAGQVADASALEPKYIKEFFTIIKN